MSYQWAVVFHSGFANTLAAADDAWTDDTYYASSLPLVDESARKWKLYNALAMANPRLRQQGSVLVEDAETGAEKTLPCLLVTDSDAGGGVSFHVFDDAVEVHLPSALDETTPEAVVREVADYLNVLAREGFSVVYEVDEGTLLEPGTDFNALVTRYKAALDYFANEKLEDDEAAFTPVAKPADTAPMKAGGFAGNFAGNVGESKPWWKFW